MQINIKVSYKSISALWASKFPEVDIMVIDGHDQALSKYSKKQVCNIFNTSKKHFNKIVVNKILYK